MTILFATDLCARVMLAGDVASQLAHAFDERLVVLHVAQRSNDFEALDREVARLQARSKVEPAVALGAVTTIDQVALKRVPRYVIVGAQGQGDTALLSTVTTALAAPLPMPVFVVRAEQRLLPLFEQGRPLRAVLTHGLDGSFGGACDGLIELSRLGPVDVVVVYVRPGTLALTADAQSMDRLRASLGVLPQVASRIWVRDAGIDARACLLDVVGEVEPDIVVCGSHRRGLACTQVAMN